MFWVMEIWHLTSTSLWEQALDNGIYSQSTFGKTLAEVGFIHAALPCQMANVVKYVSVEFREDLCVIVIDTDQIKLGNVPVRMEDGGDGELYMHIYGPIDPGWVKAVMPAGFDEAGNFSVEIN